MTRDQLAGVLAELEARLRVLDAHLEDAAALGNDSDETADLGWMRAAIATRIEVVEDLLYGWWDDGGDDE